MNIDRFKRSERTFYIKYEDKWWYDLLHHSESQILLNLADENALYYLILIEGISLLFLRKFHTIAFH